MFRMFYFEIQCYIIMNICEHLQFSFDHLWFITEIPHFGHMTANSHRFFFNCFDFVI